MSQQSTDGTTTHLETNVVILNTDKQGMETVAQIDPNMTDSSKAILTMYYRRTKNGAPVAGSTNVYDVDKEELMGSFRKIGEVIYAMEQRAKR